LAQFGPDRGLPGPPQNAFEGQEAHEPAIGFETSDPLLEVLLVFGRSDLAREFSVCDVAGRFLQGRHDIVERPVAHVLDMLYLELISRVGLHVSTSCKFRLLPG
jgi:hypothetical protein